MANKRIFKELYYIIKEKETTAKELSEKFEVSIRTIHRDINTLCESGIPIYTEVGRNGGIRILDNFILKSALFTSPEQEEIVTALQGMHLSNNFENEELLSKISALFNLKVEDWISFDTTTWSNDYLSINNFILIKEAIFKKKVIYFKYIREFGWETRKIQPYKLIYKNYNWYIQGFCLKRKQFRLFKLSKMKNIKISTTYFNRSKDIPKVTCFTENTIKVILKFDKRIAYRVYDEFAHSKIIEKNNYLYVESELPKNNHLYSYIFSFENFVEILEPYEIRLEIEKKINSINNIYKT